MEKSERVVPADPLMRNDAAHEWGTRQFETFFEGVYAATRRENERLGEKHRCGFKILNGPPLPSPPVLFLAYQPGGGLGDQERYRQSEVSWPQTLEYLCSDHKMWREVRALIDNDDRLKRCVGMNAIFFRAKSVKEWQGRLPRKVREDAEKFSLWKAEEIVNALAPKRIIVIGYVTMKQAVAEQSLVYSPRTNAEGQALARQFTLWGREAIAIPHLSGARLRSGHRQEIYGFVREYLELARVWD